jgi:hypothetical protein
VTEQVIYSAVGGVSDTAVINGLITYIVMSGFIGYFVLTLRDLRRKGASLVSTNTQTAWLRTALAAKAVTIVIAMGLIGAAYAVLVWSSYQADREVLASGDFQSISGPVDEYRAVEVRRSGRRRLLDDTPGFEPTVHERDRLVVLARDFFVRCDNSPDSSAASVGDNGKCLALHAGQQIKIDFVQISPTQYRNTPLRITIIQ